MSDAFASRDRSAPVDLRRALDDPDLFRAALMLATVAPVIALPVFAEVAPALVRGPSARTLFPFLLIGHAFTTLLFYVDPESRGLIASRRGVCVWLPVALVVGGAIAMPALKMYASVNYALALNVPVLLWHYGRQNLGGFSFWLRCGGHSPPTRAERIVLDTAFVGGALCILRLFTAETGLASFGDELRWVGRACIATTVLAALGCVVLRRMPAGRALAFLAFAGFFIPAALFDAHLLAFVSYALAHSLQYYLFVFYVSTRRARDWPWLRRLEPTGALLLAGAAVVLSVISLAGVFVSVEGRFGGLAGMALFGAAHGYVYAHFAIDAALWRMRRPDVRRFHERAFRFLKTRPGPVTDRC